MDRKVAEMGTKFIAAMGVMVARDGECGIEQLDEVIGQLAQYEEEKPMRIILMVAEFFDAIGEKMPPEVREAFEYWKKKLENEDNDSAS